MTPFQAEQLIHNLTKKINQYNDEYYQKGESSIDDNTYDILLEQLIDLETRFPEYLKTESPSQRVGGKPIENFANVRHNVPMLSLANLYSENNLRDWVTSIKSMLSENTISTICEIKIDGVAISLVYEKGLFKQAITRGNGEVGDEVSSNIKTIRSLPLKLKEPVSLELRGEVFISAQRFSIINAQRQKAGEQLFKNPRNAAAGTVRMKNPKTVAQRGLDVLLYDIVAGQISNYHSENLEYMEDLGFPVNPHRAKCSSVKEILDFCKNRETDKKNLPFDIDGVVIKVEELEKRDILGFTAKSPRWAKAWKFKAEKAKSRLINVENSIGRTGILTPVANLEPVELLGTEVKRATLHNYDHIARLGIHHNDSLYVEKGGEIIPKIVGVDYTQREETSSPLSPPTNCPVCQSLLVKTETEIDLRCENLSCPAIIETALEHFISKKGTNIQSLGSALIRQFIREKLITDIADIYLLAEKKPELSELEGMGEKSVDNLLSAIEESKTVPINQFIYALGIRRIGEKAAKTISIKIDTLEDFLNLKEDTLETLQDFGSIMRKSVLDWIENTNNRTIIKKIIDAGVKPKMLVMQKNQPFTGQTVVITGTLSEPRSKLKARLENLGFQVTSSVSKKTDYVLAGENAGSKLGKAEKLNIKVLNEEEMKKLIQRESL